MGNKNRIGPLGRRAAAGVASGDGRARASCAIGAFRRYKWLVALVVTIAFAGPQIGASAALAEMLSGGPREYPDNLFGIAIAGPTSAIATGYHGTVKVSSDGGQTWSRVPALTDDLLRRVTAAPDGATYAVSHRGKIFKGQPDGTGWSVVYEQPGLYLRDIAFATAESGWAVGHDGVILHTTDAGKVWTVQELDNYQGRDKPRLSGVVALDARRAIVVGEFGVIAQTSDGGARWTILTSAELPTLLAVAVRGESGFAVGLNGTLVRLTVPKDAALSFSTVPTGTTQHLLSVAMSPDGDTAVIGGNGLLLTLAGGKLEAAKVAAGFPIAYTWIGGVSVGEDGHTVAVGMGGTILRADAPNATFVPATSKPLVAQAAIASDRMNQ